MLGASNSEPAEAGTQHVVSEPQRKRPGTRTGAGRWNTRPKPGRKQNAAGLTSKRIRSDDPERCGRSYQLRPRPAARLPRSPGANRASARPPAAARAPPRPGRVPPRWRPASPSARARRTRTGCRRRRPPRATARGRTRRRREIAPAHRGRWTSRPGCAKGDVAVQPASALRGRLPHELWLPLP